MCTKISFNSNNNRRIENKKIAHFLGPQLSSIIFGLDKGKQKFFLSLYSFLALKKPKEDHSPQAQAEKTF